MPTNIHPNKIDHLEGLANRLIEMTDCAASPRQTSELLDEVSQLLWLASSLDPEAEGLFLRSTYFISSQPVSPKA